MKYLFYILIVLFPCTLFSQESTLSYNIDWTNNILRKGKLNIDGKAIEYDFIYLDGAIYDGSPEIPLFSDVIDLKQPASQTELVLSETRYVEIKERFPESIIEKLKEFDNQVVIDYGIRNSRATSQLYFKILPLKLSKNGNIQKLTSFKVDYKTKKKTTALKSFSQVEFKQESVLSSGQWFKIRLQEDGIYKLTYNDLKEMGLSSPQNVRIYGYSLGILPFDNSKPRPEGLQENKIYMQKGGDGIFNEGDYILFAGFGPTTWEYDESRDIYVRKEHYYSDYTYYFVTDSKGKAQKIVPVDMSVDNGGAEVSHFTDYMLHEKTEVNLIKSGRTWYGDYFNDVTPVRNFNFEIANPVAGTEAKMLVRAVGRSARNTSMDFEADNDFLGSLIFSSVNLDPNSHYSYATEDKKLFTFNNNKDINVKLHYNAEELSDEAWLDYIIVNAKRKLSLQNINQLIFRTPQTTDDTPLKFQLSSLPATYMVWDISNRHSPALVEGNVSGSSFSFYANSHPDKEYIAFNTEEGLLRPDILGDKVENQNLHGQPAVDYLIIAPNEFKSYADSLAHLHRTYSGFEVAVFSPQQIYNEFSSGSPDVTAIRDFIRSLYKKAKDKNGEPKLKHVLFFGDGSYDNKGIDEKVKSNKIITYQSANSLHHIKSYVADDFFTFLDDEESDGTSGGMDIGIGRLPVSTNNQAYAAVQKIRQYLVELDYGQWNRNLIFLADDEDSNLHMEQANGLVESVWDDNAGFSIQKLFIDAYKQVASATGETYPEVKRIINNNVDRGTLLINYTGHGGEAGLTQERIIDVGMINSWKNDKKFIFFTATCEFSRFDNHNLVSGGEYTFLNAEGGAIALFTTTRVVYSSGNNRLNNSFLNVAFEPDSYGNRRTMGEVFRLSKNDLGDDSNKRNFQLLGDPGLKIPYPFLNANTDSINGVETKAFNQALSAFDKVEITGHITNRDNQFLNDFNGTIYPVIYDKSQTVQTLNNDNIPDLEPLKFKVYNNIIFKGKASIKDGRFRFSFIVPKDIDYKVGTGKITYFFENGQINGGGYSFDMKIGGEVTSDLNDDQGPQIELFMNDTNFVFGGTTDENPKIYARVFDESGINVVGSAIGHDATAVLDDKNDILILNDFYEADKDSYKSGKIVYPLDDLEEGRHNLKVKVWDIANNSSEEFLEFVVAGSESLALKHVLNYPNPFTTRTEFMFEHNQPGQQMDVLIQVFTVSGKLVKSIKRTIHSEGYGPVKTFWDGRDDFGDKIGRGVYIYRVKVRTSDGQKAEEYQKLVILN